MQGDTGKNAPYEVKLLRCMANQLAEPYMPEWLATFIHDHYAAIVEFDVTPSGVPAHPALADFIRDHWPQDGKPVPSRIVLVALAIAICGIVEGMANDEIVADASN